MDYAFLPPEINSMRMYTGPGPGSLLAAATSWGDVAAELSSAAEDYGSVLSHLTGMYWWGPASVAMLATATPFVEWLQTTAAQAKQSAMQAQAAAAAFEHAYAMTVAPTLVAANRAQLKVLIASNFFGQNTAAIAAAEAQYAEMWAQDATAMYGYATSSAAATKLTPFRPPQQDTNPAGLCAQGSAVKQAVSSSAETATSVLSRLTSLVPQALQAIGNWPNILPEDFTVFDAIFAAYATVGVSQDVESFASGIIGAENNLGLLGGTTENPAELMPGGFGPSFSAAEKGAGAGISDAITVSVGKSNSMGPLSVPQSWTAPSTGAATALSGTGVTTIPGTEVADAAMPGVPGMPMEGSKRATSVVPRYGVRLTVMPRPPSAG